MTDLLVKEVDFLSIGTNDLIQYYLAVDRSNEFVSYLYKPLHPAVLRLIRFVIKTAEPAGKDVAVCGEMAADPLSAIVLLGFGLRTFSMNPIFIPRVKKALRAVEVATVGKVVADAMLASSAQEVEEHVIEGSSSSTPRSSSWAGSEPSPPFPPAISPSRAGMSSGRAGLAHGGFGTPRPSRSHRRGRHSRTCQGHNPGHRPKGMGPRCRPLEHARPISVENGSGGLNSRKRRVSADPSRASSPRMHPR